MKKHLIPLFLGVVLLAIGLYVDFFYLKLIGGIILAMVGISISYYFYVVVKKKENDDTQDTDGYYSGCVIIPLFVMLAYGYDEDRYISEIDFKQHIYQDCPLLRNSNDMKNVVELEAMFYLCFPDCKSCKERDDKIRKQRKVVKEIKKLEYEIKEMQLKIEALKNGVDVSDIKEPEIVEYYDSAPSEYQ